MTNIVKQQQQLALELSATELGKERFQDKTNRMIEDGNYGEASKAARRTAEPFIQDMMNQINEYRKEQSSVPRKSVFIKLTDQASSRVLAKLALGQIISCVARKNSDEKFIAYSNATAIQIGKRIDNERMMETLYEENKAWFDHLVTGSNDLDEVHEALAVIKDIPEIAPWTTDEHMKVGYLLLVLAEKANFITMDTIIKDKKTVKVVNLTQHVKACLDDLIESEAVAKPLLMPMVVQPLPWSGHNDGGYITHRTTIVKRFVDSEHKRQIKEELTDELLDGLNATQNTAWEINHNMLDVVKWCMGIGTSVDVDTLKRGEVLKDCIRNGETIAGLIDGSDKRKTGALLIAAFQAVRIAEQFKAEPEIYFPHNMDHRGRVYPLPEVLNPQGAKPIKSLLQFSEGHELDEDSAYWLAVHTANTFGFDKAPLDERVQWVNDNMELIHRVADNYALSFDEWKCADDPFNFVAACFEMSAYARGETVISHIPIAFDGSCSGLQHFAALFKDEIGARSVNLIPDLPRQDVYADVGEKVKAALPHHDQIITRKLMKRPVMTYGYGSVKNGMTTQIKDELADNDFNTAKELADTTFDMIEETCEGAAKARAWTQEVAGAHYKKREPVRWTTPDGLPVTHAEYQQKKERPKFSIGDTTVDGCYNVQLPKLSVQKMKNGISPNLVHSLDATHLRMVAKAAEAEGMPIGLIHDSFSSNAANAGRLFQLIREEFVRMYQGPVLNNLMRDFGTNEAPEVGNLDVGAVLHTEFSFA